MQLYVDIPTKAGTTINMKCTQMMFSIPGWSRGVPVFIHRKTDEPKYWTVTDIATMLALPINPDGCKLKRHAIDWAVSNLEYAGEDRYKEAVRKALNTSATIDTIIDTITDANAA